MITMSSKFISASIYHPHWTPKQSHPVEEVCDSIFPSILAKAGWLWCTGMQCTCSKGATTNHFQDIAWNAEELSIFPDKRHIVFYRQSPIATHNMTLHYFDVFLPTMHHSKRLFSRSLCARIHAWSRRATIFWLKAYGQVALSRVVKSSRVDATIVVRSVLSPTASVWYIIL